jgi:UDP-N-acetylglucosamine acyltransferase
LPDALPRPEPDIHPAAIIHPGAKLGPGVKIGPYVVIGGNVELGEGTRVAPHAVIEGWTRIGKGNEIGVGAVIGAPPQDHKYTGARSFVTIGDRNIIREYVTIHRSATAEAATTVGNDNYLMAFVHLAHDCRVGNSVNITNSVGLSGHIEVEDFAVLGGMSAYHQFVRIGAYAMVGGNCGIRMDVVPYAIATGEPLRIYGVNRVGLRRAGFKPEQQRLIKDAYRILFWSGLPFTAAIERLKAEMGSREEVVRIIRFVEKSKRGLTPGLRLDASGGGEGEELEA